MNIERITGHPARGSFGGAVLAGAHDGNPHAVADAACYDDGTAESGHPAFGRDRFGFAVRSTSDGDVAVSARVTGGVGRYTPGSGAQPEAALFDIDGDQWEFVIDPHGASAHLGGPVRQAEGLFRRVGDLRRPLVWAAALEVPA